MLDMLQLRGVQDFKRMWMNDIIHDKKLMADKPQLLDKIFDENFRTAQIHLINSHRNTKTDMDLIEFIDTVYRESVIVIENGVLFSSKAEDASPATDVEEELKADRKIIKKESNFNLTEGDKALGARQNIIQNMVKLVMNQWFRIFERMCARSC